MPFPKFTASSSGLEFVDILSARGYNVITGFDGDLPGTFETLTGTAGRDLILGLGGGDQLEGGAGDDILLGGAGDDFIVPDNGAIGNDIIIGGSGIDWIDYRNSAAVSGVRVDLEKTGVQRTGGAGNDVILGIENVYGTNFADNIRGSNADNQIIGWDGNDVIDGRGGNDFINGGLGNDILRGGSGSDILDGGAGTDVLTGGSGGDAFAFFTSDPASPDTITDFNSAEFDTIDLDFLSFHPLVDHVRFIGSDTFNGDLLGAFAIPEIRAENLGGNNWVVEVDRNGDLAADFRLNVHSNAALTMDDFFF